MEETTSRKRNREKGTEKALSQYHKYISKHQKMWKKEKGKEEEKKEEEPKVAAAETEPAVEKEEVKESVEKPEWIVAHMYDASLIPKEDFKTVLLYLEGMKGMGRATLREEAARIAKETVVTDKKDKKSVLDRIKKTRAEAIVKVFS
ncbi:hypothetical protein AV274_5646 [Blastocystis sp. ATCC 50177/Nand II]|uniref:WKF domain-containing protein n=1 Tax=Blastocystis sp. subtype 1 (strain ATCC 50177 / NandII) TaxID=478820 RepID=A0A196S6F9_BLAHN|nr:hypothetical protein AV274_5646 [Blastocystis sp. ATCC 50177/Nand II]